jgi:hypothetical protein
MELVGSETGQCLQLIYMDEVRPLRGGTVATDAAAEIVRRYRFQTFPTKFEGQAVKFELGMIAVGEITIPITSLEIYIDGVIINTRNTKDSDLVMDDFIEWSKHTFNYREPKSGWLTRKYLSRIVVDFEQSAGETFIKHFEILRRILVGRFESDRHIEPQLTFAPHPAGEAPYQHTWSLTPRITQPLVPNRYFSQAPLSTPAHFDMLCELEAAALAR